MQTVTLSLHRFEPYLARLWVLGQMGAARLLLPRVPGIGSWKLCGSGVGEGFTPLPNTAVWAILATWDSEEAARHGVTHGKPFVAWRKRATECWTLYLQPSSARGAWAGEAPFVVEDDRQSGPIAALTRATVRPAVALKFWERVPDISGVIGSDPNVAFKIGIGEVPWLHQVTFSIWPDEPSMANFARKDGPHARAIRAVRDGNWFREELYARFRILGDAGSWGGASPLSGLDLSA